MLADLLPVRERVLGPEHLDTLATRYNLAYWTERAASQSGSLGPDLGVRPAPAARPGPCQLLGDAARSGVRRSR